jgi:hypothetical protein
LATAKAVSAIASAWPGGLAHPVLTLSALGRVEGLPAGPRDRVIEAQ